MGEPLVTEPKPMQLVVHALCVGEDEVWPAIEAKAANGVERVDARELARHAPDVHLLVLDSQQVLRARCSCWWRDTPQAGSGVIGHYAAADDEAARVVIEAACGRLAAEGCERVIAPMDGNTWRAYRFIIERGEEPPFFLEPNHPEAWLRQFVAAGFETLATYTSALTLDLQHEDARVARAEERFATRGITIRAWNPAETERELRRIFALSRASFSGNLFYAPIEEAEFMEQYARVLPAVRPELVLLAERATQAGAGGGTGGDAELIGFLFAVPDLYQMKRGARAGSDTGAAIDTIIIKTVAVAPGLAQAGLGSVLVNRVQREAHRLGYRRAIHALMHEDNVSQNISRRYAQTIRRYALLGKRLERGMGVNADDRAHEGAASPPGGS
jgi:GNAT superfamily N-acetyltransferase